EGTGCPLAMSAEVAVSEGAGREMEALCSELLLPPPGEAGAVESPDVASTDLAGTPPLSASQDLLLAEASMSGEGAHAEGSNVEIFIEAVAGNVTLSNAANATGMGCREGNMGPTALDRGTEVWLGPLSLPAGTLGTPQCPCVSDPVCIMSVVLPSSADLAQAGSVDGEGWLWELHVG
uniref:Uncharacterized protein n=1 Tax=Falco tinnunculus TaxID=100819 RepID=A0A8C4V376_FALTI